jgi:hypothetical protein
LKSNQPPNKFTRVENGTRYLVDELEKLLSMPIGSEQELETWYAESKRVQAELPDRFPDLNYPHEVWHFLADADIRSRDPGYRQHQERVIIDYIERVRRKNASA